VGNVETKTLEIVAPRSSLTPGILDDDPAQLSLLSEMTSEIGYESLLTDDPEEAVRLVQSGACRVILADVHLPGIHAYEFLDRLLRVDAGIHVIIISQEYTLESALEAIRRGTTDFLPKPLDRLRLKRALDDVASLYDQRRRVRALEEQLLRDLEFHGIVGKSPVSLADLPENLQHRGQRTAEGAEWRPLSLDEVRKVHIQRVLAMCMVTVCGPRKC
jgi:DNA-binding NtrC family response regulator